VNPRGSCGAANDFSSNMDITADFARQRKSQLEEAV
jgi:hypothetical protein